MKIRCIAPFGQYKPGDESEAPDGAEVAAQYWVPVQEPAKPAPPAAAKDAS
jgi:hypothetical protein